MLHCSTFVHMAKTLVVISLLIATVLILRLPAYSLVVFFFKILFFCVECIYYFYSVEYLLPILY